MQARTGDRAQPYFFLAYAHTHEQPWVTRLYNELNKQIIEQTAGPPDQPAGFMDQTGIAHGADWPGAIAEALSTCRVFVPLYSRRYFTRPECGREWNAFYGRLLGHRALRGGQLTPIVPALWTPLRDEHVPPAARRIQANFQAVHRTYADEGLYTLIKNRAYRSTYLRVVSDLRQKIIDAAESDPLDPCAPAELDLAVDAFNPDAELPAWPGWSNGVPANRRLTIIVAAPSVEHLPEGRDRDAYGARDEAWQPFAGHRNLRIGDVAAGVARDRDLTPVCLPLAEALQLDWAKPETGLGVVVVDPWLSLLPAAAGMLNQVDELCAAGRIGALVVWDGQDPQTRAHTKPLQGALRACAPRFLGDLDIPLTMGAAHVRSLEQFSQECPAVLDRTFNRYLPQAEAHPPSGDPGGMPVLRGPVPSSASYPTSYSAAHAAPHAAPGGPGGD